MNLEIENLFNDLLSVEDANQGDAVLFLSLLLERHVPTFRNDPSHLAILPTSLAQLNFTESEKDEFVTKLCGIVRAREIVEPARRASIACALAKCGRLEGLAAALEIFAVLSDSLNEESLYSMLACITPSICCSNDPRIRELLLEYQTELALEKVEEKYREQMVEQFLRLRECIVKIKNSADK